MSTLKERINTLYELFKQLEKTTGRLDKERLIAKTLESTTVFGFHKDFTYALEILDGRHKLGYTFYRCETLENNFLQEENYCTTLQKYLQPLFYPKQFNRFDRVFLNVVCAMCSQYWYFVQPLVNRRWRLGIGKSLLGVNATSPMLAKKYEPDKLPNSSAGYYVTEKLDGNRCIASFDKKKEQWQFTSRSGKPLNVQFDMSAFERDMIFDGEIISRSHKSFNNINGLVNSKSGDKSDLLYIIFDIPSLNLASYAFRRAKLSKLPYSDNVGVLPVIDYFAYKRALFDNIDKLLDDVTSKGGEGLMINLGDRPYEQKRTNGLLKVKKTHTMDMQVIELLEGTGKNEGLVGALSCFCKERDRIYRCRVGSGLNDYQRNLWANYPETILGKIVEVAYFSLSQDSSSQGSNEFSLRFPRLVGVRDDKEDTSSY